MRRLEGGRRKRRFQVSAQPLAAEEASLIKKETLWFHISYY